MFKCLAPMRLIGCLVIVTELTISAAAENKPAQPGPARPEPGELEIEELYPRIFQVTFPSASLKKDGRFVVVLPENWSQVKPNEQRMLVILHGRGRNERTLVEDDRIRQQLLDSGLLLILPRGEDGWYIDSPVQKADLYETHLVRDAP